MFIKLARCEKTGFEETITKCCEENGAHFISLTDHCFGILVTKYEMSFGREAEGEPEITLKTLIDVYKSVVANGLSYTNFLPNRHFFTDVFEYCDKYESDIAVEGVEIRNQFGGDAIFTEPDQIKDVISAIADDNNPIIRLFLACKKVSIILNEHGLVDIADRYNFYVQNKDAVINLIKSGLGMNNV